jgi:hypothetical protein
MTANRFIRANRDWHSVRDMARIFGVSCDACYRRKK